jgi:hypothetical protein
MADINQAQILQILQNAVRVNQELSQAILVHLAALQAEKAETQWVSLEEGVKALGSVFSTRKILDDIKAGYLKHGTHYIDISNGSRPTYAVKVLALRKVYESPPEKRQHFKQSA